MAIPIYGMNADALAKTSTVAKTSRRDFPVNPVKWARFTGAVEDVRIKILGEDEKLSITIRNGDCVAEILVGLDIRKLFADSTKPAEEQIQDNLTRLLLAAKVLDIALPDGSGIDDKKFNKARGKLVAFSGKQKGTRIWEGRTFPKCSYFLDGEAQELVAVAPWGDDSPAPVYSGTSTPAPSPSGGAFNCPF